METFYQSTYLTIQFDQERNILFTHWSTHEYMEDEEYRKEIENYEKGIITYKPKNVLVHSKEAKYVIPIETQDWMTKKFNALYEEYETKKVAVITSSDFITQLSSEQVVEEITDAQNQRLQMLFFDQEEKAIEWIGNKKRVKEKAI